MLPNHVIRDGPPGADLVLLIAGTGYPGVTWEGPFLDALRREFRVVTYDHRGCGETSGTDGLYTTEMLADDAAELLGHLGEPAHVVGHSMGGRVAQWLTAKAPERVRSLVLAGSGLGGNPRESCGVPVATCRGLLALGYEGFVRDVQRRTFFTEEFTSERPEVVSALGEAFWGARPELEDYLKHVAARQSHDSHAVAPEIQQRTLVVVGSLDTHVGGTGSHVDQSHALSETIPHADLVVMPGCRHGIFWERPQETATLLLEWLAGAQPH